MPGTLFTSQALSVCVFPTLWLAGIDVSIYPRYFWSDHTHHIGATVNSSAVGLWSVLVLVLDWRCYGGHLVNGWCACEHKNIYLAYVISRVFLYQKKKQRSRHLKTNDNSFQTLHCRNGSGCCGSPVRACVPIHACVPPSFRHPALGSPPLGLGPAVWPQEVASGIWGLWTNGFSEERFQQTNAETWRWLEVTTNHTHTQTQTQKYTLRHTLTRHTDMRSLPRHPGCECCWHTKRERAVTWLKGTPGLKLWPQTTQLHVG